MAALAGEMAARSLVMTGGPHDLGLPGSAPGNWPGTVRATLLAGQQRLGMWEFQVQFRSFAPLLRLSPGALDQCFLTIDHPFSAPVAYRHELFALPETLDDLRLAIETDLPPTYGPVQQLYYLKWPAAAAAEQQLRNWRQARTPVIEWFYVELTTRCNLACPFCPSRILRRPRAAMSNELASSVFQQIADYRAQHPAIMGYARLEPMVFLHVMGEPLLHPQFETMVALARERGLTLALFTNVSLLTAHNIRKILESGIAHVTLSLNVVSGEGYRQLGARDTIQDQERRVLNFLRQRAERGAFNIHVDLQYLTSAGRTVLGSSLLDSREQVWKLFGHWLSVARHLDARGDDCHGAAEAASPAAVADPLAPDASGDASLRIPIAANVHLVVKSGCSFGNVMLPSGLAVLPAERGRCPYNNPSRVMCIFVDGSVSFCSLDYENSVALGNLRQETIATLWTSERMRAIREAMDQGRLIEPVCQVCLGKVVNENGGQPA